MRADLREAQFDCGIEEEGVLMRRAVFGIDAQRTIHADAKRSFSFFGEAFLADLVKGAKKPERLLGQAIARTDPEDSLDHAIGAEKLLPHPLRAVEHAGIGQGEIGGKRALALLEHESRCRIAVAAVITAAAKDKHARALFVHFCLHTLKNGLACALHERIGGDSQFFFCILIDPADHIRLDCNHQNLRSAARRHIFFFILPCSAQKIKCMRLVFSINFR